ncbi:hypothetical protein LZD49_11185 [Dyadobacter sp. CY261]|uniref:hypothetical protein n=1 Tax=Dyadobacter sp. CY261 TaxID=2907203 RepID=UPI001F3640DB|nr:hypothetical protein [Dyadobacter sp. CY261]MCF0071037.1 hypothetical protein [Dyadobacter sp. CY261]
MNSVITYKDIWADGEKMYDNWVAGSPRNGTLTVFMHPKERSERGSSGNQENASPASHGYTLAFEISVIAGAYPAWFNRTYLGEFEEIVLLGVAVQTDRSFSVIVQI